MVLDYRVLSNEIIKLIEERQTMILATCVGNHVTARTMNVVNDDLTIYFQTGKNGEKGKQIHENPNVAIAVDNIQIEAAARFTDNTDEITLYRLCNPE